MLMSDADAKNNKQPGDKEPSPTASFSDSAPVVVHWTNRSIRSVDFLNMNDYCTGVSAKGDSKE